MTRTASPLPPQETYGIHILKVCAIMLQVIAHSYLWSVQKGLIETTDIGNFWNNVTYTFLSMALILPMTAGAVLRMVTPVDAAQDRITHVDWRTIIMGAALLALLESVKQMLVYDSAAFFSWNVLHVIAVTCPLILLIGRFSIAFLWSVALTIMFITPLMIELISPYEMILAQVHGRPPVPLVGGVLALGLTVLVLDMMRRVWRSATMQARYKVRVLTLLTAVWAVLTWLLWHMPESPLTMSLLKTLPLGATIGTTSGMHIWAFFPWAGSIMLGFLVYDAIVRLQGSRRIIWLIAGMGAALLYLFYAGFANDVTSTLTAKAVFGGYHFNRLPSKMLMVVGLFCMAVPLCIWAARRGWEKPYVVLLSRYVLWLYLYQTTLQMAIPPWVQHTFGAQLTAWQCVGVATVLSVVGALLLPLVIRRIPLSLNLRLAKAG